MIQRIEVYQDELILFIRVITNQNQEKDATQRAIASKQAQEKYAQDYKKYEEQFVTPLQQLFIVPANKVPPVADYQTLSQNLVRLMTEASTHKNSTDEKEKQLFPKL